MTDIKCFYENGTMLTTMTNLTFKEAKEYFEGKYFNLGDHCIGDKKIKDNIQKCIMIKLRY